MYDIEERFDTGTLLVRKIKHGPRCGDLFVVVQQKNNGYRMLSIRKNGHMTVTFVRNEIAHTMYDFIGFTHNIDELVELSGDLQ